jgi:hypothetical protein
MKVNSPIIVAFVAGAVLASLPYTLSSGKTVAQGAGPVGQGQGFPPIQGGPQPAPPGQGFPGQGGQGQFRPNGVQVTSMTTSGQWLFASGGDTIYKIDMSSMQVMGQVRLQPQRPQNQGGQNQGLGRGGSSRPGNGNGNIPPSGK